MFPPGSEDNHLEDYQKSIRALAKLRRQVLKPLRTALELPESYMSRGQWSTLPYKRVAKVAMTMYEPLFQLHDGPRFQNFQDDETLAGAGGGPAKPKMIAAAPLHQLVHIMQSWHEHKPPTREYVVREWNKEFASLHTKGLFSNCLVIFDSVMRKGPNIDKLIRVGLGLSALISGLSQQGLPWGNRVFAFRGDVQFHVLPFLPQTQPLTPESLTHTLNTINNIQCTVRFNLTPIFEWILSMAVAQDIKETDMVKTIFVFTNKEFDETSVPTIRGKPSPEEMATRKPFPWHHEYVQLRRKFKAEGYANVFPQVVFWNLQGQHSAAFTTTDDGIMKLKGYSDAFLRIFLDLGGVVEPEDEMYASISSAKYQDLQLID
ncbi:hypothetical protein PR202_ga08215 [Eleusine coracana subsp. coracana]|uniref:Uncharacterized protein n=1 Tax=Eleusine coracana subsp. coracana TaxID=191504 RepID=A0AAV5C264_ELECO|nr:hypothetical protein QOZ80_1AG0047750 [Eleusine coracana subsp. coracana]GJM91803.1 hypothetical protein PR202_ga08215 [Eleusine coracana subsp. coracana]